MKVAEKFSKVEINFTFQPTQMIAMLALPEGDDLNNLRVSETYLQISPMTRALYLWTERFGKSRIDTAFNPTQMIGKSLP